MEQPELGKKILELRKANGLTQEELVARCNINVRTIQRIEAGEVTPRSHTVRSIFAALEIDLDQLQAGAAIPNPQKENTQWLLIAFISGLIYFILAFWEAYMDYELSTSLPISIPAWEYTFVKISILICYSLFMLGFYQMGHIWKNNWIKPASLLSVVGIVICIAADLYLFYNMDTDPLPLIAAQAILFGSVYLIFGFGLYRYKKEFGNMAISAGVVVMITGLLFISVVLALLGLLILAISEILLLIVLFRAYEKIRH
jgi:transcriptional regulator with XRE-family HTH domain